MRNKKWFASMTLAAVLAAGMTTTAFADWSKNNDRWYYYNDANGQMVKNDWVQDEGKWYYMDANGCVIAGAMNTAGVTLEATERHTRMAGKKSAVRNITLQTV